MKKAQQSWDHATLLNGITLKKMKGMKRYFLPYTILYLPADQFRN
jgi:hypothetical protein